MQLMDRRSAGRSSHTGRLLRNAVMLLAIAGVLTVPAVALAQSQKTKVHPCGNINHNIAVTTTGKVSCTTAKNVARAWFKGKKNSNGFSCVKIKVPVGAGYQVSCQSGSKKILILPE